MHRTTSGLDLVGGASMGLFYIISGFVLMLGYGSAPTRPPPARPPARRLDLQSRLPRRRRALTHNLHLTRYPTLGVARHRMHGLLRRRHLGQRGLLLPVLLRAEQGGDAGAHGDRGGTGGDAAAGDRGGTGGGAAAAAEDLQRARLYIKRFARLGPLWYLGNLLAVPLYFTGHTTATGAWWWAGFTLSLLPFGLNSWTVLLFPLPATCGRSRP